MFDWPRIRLEDDRNVLLYLSGRPTFTSKQEGSQRFGGAVLESRRQEAGAGGRKAESGARRKNEFSPCPVRLIKLTTDN
jgi:hypothetical protein